MSNHTPTPWNYKVAIMPNGIEKSFDCAIVDGDGHIIAETFGKVAYNRGTMKGAYLERPAPANAAHIVRCVNSHDQLVEALRLATNELNIIRARDGAPQHIDWDRGQPIQADGCTKEWWNELTEKCFAALALAQKGTP